jgi:diguanylate cyclase (GGDEF)-like protein
VAAAAWQRPGRRQPQRHDWAALAIPSACTLVAVAVLVVCAVGRGHELATALAAAVVTAVSRTFWTFREVRNLAETTRRALTDDLTGLPNRRGLHADLERRIADQEPVGLLLVDLDRFKDFNDALGHAAGDELLRALAERLSGALGSGDRLARFGGDEFGVVLAGRGDERALRDAGDRLRDALEAPFELDGLAAQLDASLGAAGTSRLLRRRRHAAAARRRGAARGQARAHGS